ncbi:hypothetical protein MG5_05064 [Candida albicans P57072]|nr:hypothetical protein MG5_05064 [Candida albicans P57072]KGU24342.1 Hap43p-induced protein [Candida albicans P75063]KHC30177.1 Hap43p-induced protein [Candida albicans P76055]KHC31175.1 Hap43p-induced protein [Candida albicans P76067]
MIMDSKLAFILFLIKMFILIEMIIQEFFTKSLEEEDDYDDDEQFDEKFNNNNNIADNENCPDIIHDEEKSLIYNTMAKQYESRPTIMTLKKKKKSRTSIWGISLQEFIFFIICFIMIIFDWIVIYTNA